MVDHLLKGDNLLEDCVDSPQTRLQAWVHVRVGMLRHLLGFNSFGPSKWRRWAKIHGTHNTGTKKWKNTTKSRKNK